MKLAVLTGLAAVFDEYGTAVKQRPAQDLRELSCEVRIELRGAVAVVEQRQQLANEGPDALAASLEQALPRGAQVTGFAWKGRGAREHALPVRADSPSVVGAPGITGADPATLFVRGDVMHAIVQPLAAGADIELVTHYAALATVRDGGLELTLPARAATGKLTPCRGTVRALPGPGATVRAIHVNGRAVTGARADFVVDADATQLVAKLAITGTSPLAWVQSAPTGDGTTASLLTVVAPPGVRRPARRVVLAIDSSKSMDLVGRHRVAQVIERVTAALPPGSELEAILYDRTATRVFGALRPVSATTATEIVAALGKRAPTNGSDLARAFRLAHETLATTRGESQLVVITDGVTGELEPKALIAALDLRPAAIDVHAIVLDPATTRSPGIDVLQAPIGHYGGGYVEVAADELDAALPSIDAWMRPATVGLALPGHDIPRVLPSGSGFTRAIVHRGAPRLALTVGAQKLVPRPAPAAPAAAFAPRPDDAPATAFAVLAPTGKVARQRRAVTAGGGRYERVLALPDPDARLASSSTSAPPSASAIARDTLARMFRETLQRRAYVCYQRALGANPKLAGTARFTIRLGRGEVTDVQLAGLGDAAFDACLVDAAYLMAPPAPDFAVNADDQTVATYPIAFTLREDKASVVPGDADSESPLDLEAIRRANDRAGKVKVDAKTPLGGLKAPKGP